MIRLIIKLVVGIILVAVLGFFVGIPYLNSTLLENDVESFLENKSKTNQISFNSAEFSRLPSIVKKYLRKSIKKGSSSPQNCQYKTIGKFKTDINSEWLNISSKNYYSTTVSDFIKIIETQNNYYFWTLTVSKYLSNKASTNSKLLSSITTDDFTGNKLSRSYLVLYLLESVFCPSVLMPNMNVSWKAISNYKAQASIWHDNFKGTAVFYFNKNGDVTKIVTDDRYMPGSIDYKRETFTISFANYKDFDNFNIPTFFEYQWNLAGDDFTFGRFYISDITYK